MDESEALGLESIKQRTSQGRGGMIFNACGSGGGFTGMGKRRQISSFRKRRREKEVPFPSETCVKILQKGGGNEKAGICGDLFTEKGKSRRLCGGRPSNGIQEGRG